MKNLRNKPQKYIFGSISFILLGAIFLTGCSGIGLNDEVSKLVPTYAEQTLQALSIQQTLTSYETLVSQLTQVAQVTPTPEDTATTPEDTATAEPTTAAPTATPTESVPCNWAAYVRDVTIPDNTKMDPGTPFTKTWRIKNIGSCTWTTDYDFVFVSGNSMNASTRIGLPVTVAPGQTLDISVLMQAPNVDGFYAGYWMLVDASGNQFGIGPNADGNIWVKINVSTLPKVVFDFTDKACSARWDSSASRPSFLPCPGKETDDAMGYVLPKDNPYREDGGKENEHGLVTSPDNTSITSAIVGFYPSFTVQNGDEFRAVIGCEYGSTHCDVEFSLIVQLKPEFNETLGSWREVNEGQYRSIVVDLSSLAGKEVNFILRVLNKHTTADNEALWIYPRIVRTR
jgi:putative lipoic acid-binding regulatory protein